MNSLKLILEVTHMNVLFISLLDFSSIEEKSIYTDLVREFVKDGHNLFIISPTEKRKNEPTHLIEKRNLTILKLQIGNMQKTNIIEKGISLLSIESKFKTGIVKYFSKVKFDLVLYSTPPITLQKAVKFVKDRDSSKTYLLLKDIFPQNALDLDMLEKNGVKGLLYKFFRLKEENLYKLSDYIGCMSQANVDFVLKNNPAIPEYKVEVCPNSIEPMELNDQNISKCQIRKKYDIPKNRILFIYGGNIGKPQGVDFIIQCLESNKLNDKVFFLIVGSGTEYNKLFSYFSKNKPHNAKLMYQLSKRDYDELTYASDVGMIFLDKRFTIPNIPSRILSYMQASIPVLASTDINTDLKDIIVDGEFGYWCESGDLVQFNEHIDRLCDDNVRRLLGMNARKFLVDNYTSRHSYEIIINHFR